MQRVLILLVCVAALTSCSVNMNGWNTEQIDPSNNIVTKDFKLKPFEKVNMRCVGAVELVQSEAKDGIVEITAPDNYIELYQLESDHAELNIDFTRHGINIQAKQVRIKIYTNDLTKIHNSGAANIWMEKLDTDKIEILNSGVGEIRVSGITDDAKLVCSGVGSIDAEHLKALNVVANVSGVGSITCHASESIEGSVSGVGSLKYAGTPKHKDTHRSGVGSITAL